jgi:hypothetical protein
MSMQTALCSLQADQDCSDQQQYTMDEVCNNMLLARTVNWAQEPQISYTAAGVALDTHGPGSTLAKAE